MMFFWGSKIGDFRRGGIDALTHLKFVFWTKKFR